MKKQLASIFMCFISVFLNAQDCPPVSVDLSTQQDVDDFPILYPDCSHILGNVSISSGITNLNGLNNITVIDGDLFMEAANTLDDLSGLSNLTTVGGQLSLPPTDISGLTSLTNVDRWVILMENILDASQLETLSNQITEISYLEISDASHSFSGSLHLCENITQLTTLNFYNVYFSTTGFNNLASVEELNVQNFPEGYIELPDFENLSSIGYLSLVGIDTPGSPLVMGTGANCEIEHVYITDTNISGFDGLTGVTYIGVFEVWGYSLDSFHGLENVAFMMDLSLHSVESLSSFEGLEGLTHLGGLHVEHCLNLLTLNGLDNVLYFEELFLIANEGLSSLDALNPEAAILNIVISDNLSISNCAVEGICNNLDVINSYILNNGAACNDVYQVISLCEGNYATGTVYYDLNCNGIQEETEALASDLLILDDQNEPMAWVSSFDGVYYALLPYNAPITFHAQVLPGYDADPVSITTSTLPVVYENDIAICPQGTIHNLATVITPVNGARPGFEHSYMITVHNYGTEPASGVVGFITNGMFFSVVDNGGATVSSGELTWEFTNLNPMSSWYYYITCFTPSETPLGSIYHLHSYTHHNDELISDINPLDNEFNLDQEVVGSYDPNEIVVDQIYVNYDEIIADQNIELDYLIHFQNVGTASAINVRVENEIEDDLNISSLQLLETSHDVEIAFENNRIIWTFENIDLPANADDEAGSMGFIHYRIKTNSNIPLETLIENNCQIYFDFNEPILTNTATTEFYLCPESVNIIGPNEICVFNTGTFEADDVSLTHYEWVLDGNLITEETLMEFTFTQPGSHELLLMAENPYCSSVQTIELQVVENPAIGVSIESLETCNEVTLLATSNAPVTWSLNDNVVGYGSANTVFENGDYIAVAENVCGTANASITVDIPEGPTDLHILEDTGVLSSTLTGISYNWYFEGEQIPDANESTYTPTELGNYSLHVVFESGCSLDADYAFFTISISKDFEETIFLSPNPAKEFSTLNLKEGSEYVHLEMYTITGQLIISENITRKNHRIDTSQLDAGLYVIQLSNADRKVCRLPLMVE